MSKESRIKEIVAELHDHLFKVELKDWERNDFGWALTCLKEGKTVARRGWHPDSSITLEEQLLQDSLPFIALFLPGDRFIPWIPNMSDLLADDWFLK